MILLIDHLDSFTFNLYQAVEELGFHCKVERARDLTLARVKKIKPRAIILSPGPGHPKDAVLATQILRSISKSIPTLGVCLGHQAIGQAFGARIARVARPLHGKVSEILHDGRGVFQGMKGKISVTRYHSLYVVEKSLPGELEPTAWTVEGKILMGVRHREYPVEGVQFHPESVCTVNGKKMIGNFLRRTR